MLNRADWVPLSATGAAISTSATTLLSKNVVSGGVYHLAFQIYLVNVGAPTNINFGFSGPTVTLCKWLLSRWTATNVTPLNDIFTSFADAVAGTANAAVFATGEGIIIPSSNAVLNLRGIRVAGTSSTVQAGSWLECERIG